MFKFNWVTKFIKWCNQNSGFLAFIAMVVTIILSIHIDQIDLSSTKPFWYWLWNVLAYPIKVPLFTFILIPIIVIIYWLRLKNRYTRKIINMDFLIGYWKNEWNNSQGPGSEECEIKEGGKYYIMGQHWFDLQEFNYDKTTNKITFWKTGVQPGDNRRVLNTLEVVNNDLLIGEEAGNHIKYSKIYSDK